MLKKVLSHLLFGLLLCMSGILLPPSSQARENIVLSNGEWPPYFAEEFKYGGLGSRIGFEAFALAGIDVKYEYLPWKRGYESARMGNFHGTIGWRKTPEREKDFYFSDPILMANVVLFHKGGSRFDWNNIDDIAHLDVGATLGYSYVDQLAEAVKRQGGTLDIAPTDEMNLQKLVAGRIDIFPCGKAVGYYLLRTKFTPGTADMVTHHPKPLIDSPLYLLISKSTPNGQELITRFNKGLKELRESGRYEQFELESLKGEYLPTWDSQRLHKAAN